MSYSRIVGGSINKLTKGEHSIYSDGDISSIANKKISVQGDNGGVEMRSDPQDPPELENMTGITCKVDIRPSSDWKGEGYGFDWFRTGDYKEVIAKAVGNAEYAKGDVSYDKLVARQFKESYTEEDYLTKQKTEIQFPAEAIPNNVGLDIDPRLLVTNNNEFQQLYYQDKVALEML